MRGVLARVRGGLPFGPAGMREGLDAIDVLREGLLARTVDAARRAAQVVGLLVPPARVVEKAA